MTKEYEISDFTKISAGFGFNVKVYYGEKFKVVVTTKDDHDKKLIVEKEEDTLVLNYKQGFFSSNPGLSAEVTLPFIDGLRISGASNIELMDRVLVAERLMLKASGASSMAGYIESSFTEIHLSGASSVEITGSTNECVVHLSGASHILAKDFTTDSLEAKVSGASHITMEVVDLIEGKLSGASSINYLGEPKIESATSGVSSISAYYKEDEEIE